MSHSPTCERAEVGKRAPRAAQTEAPSRNTHPKEEDRRGIVVDGHVVVPQGQSLEQLLKQPDLLAPPMLVLPGLAAAGRVVMVFAREKIGKSTFLGYCAARASSGGDLLGVAIDAKRVLWIGLEESLSDAVRRFDSMNANPANIIVVSRLNGLRQLKAEILWAKPDVVILDSLAAFAIELESENDASAVQSLLQPLVQFIHETGVALVLVHHSNKSEGGGYRGSVAIGAAMDMLIELTADDADPAVRHLRPKGRFELDPYSVRYSKEAGTFTAIGSVAPDVQPKVELPERIMQHLRRSAEMGGTGSATKEAIRLAVGGKAANVDRAITKLIEEGRIRHGGHRRGYELVDPTPLKAADSPIA